jgi:hypothetical protein
MQDEHQEAVVELKALQNSATQVRDLVLKRSDEASSPVALLSLVVDLIEGRANFVTTHGVHWGAHLALITTLPHFLSHLITLP